MIAKCDVHLQIDFCYTETNLCTEHNGYWGEPKHTSVIGGTISLYVLLSIRTNKCEKSARCVQSTYPAGKACKNKVQPLFMHTTTTDTTGCASFDAVSYSPEQYPVLVGNIAHSIKGLVHAVTTWTN